MKKLFLAFLTIASLTLVALSVSACVVFTEHENHEHEYGLWQITDPTMEKEGFAVRTCDDCDVLENGHTQYVVFPKLTEVDAYDVKSYTQSDCTRGGYSIYKFVSEKFGEFTFAVNSEPSEHAYGEWIEEVPATLEATGVKGHYVCVSCGKYFDANHKELSAEDLVIAKLDDEGGEQGGGQGEQGGEETPTDPTVLSANLSLTISSDVPATITEEYVLANGVKVVASSSKTVTAADSNKSKEGIQYSRTLKLGGMINADSRYIEFKVAGACVVKVIALSGSTSEARNLNFYTSASDKTLYASCTVDSGSALSILYYYIDAAGTYYLGSASGGINIYAVYVTFGAHEKMNTAWAFNTEYHYHECADEDCAGVHYEKALHTYGEGVVSKPATVDENGEMTYTCTVCGCTRTESIEKLSPAPDVVAADTLFKISAVDSSSLNATGGYKLANGIYVMGGYNDSNSALISIESNSKSLGDESFTHRLKLGGKMTATQRYVSVTVSSACTLTVYGMSSSSSDTRTLLLYKSLTLTDENLVASVASIGGDKLYATEFSLPAAGTYYFGSQSGGFNVYGLGFKFPSE